MVVLNVNVKRIGFYELMIPNVDQMYVLMVIMDMECIASKCLIMLNARMTDAKTTFVKLGMLMTVRLQPILVNSQGPKGMFVKILTNVLLQKKIMIVMLPNMPIKLILAFINVFPRMPHVGIRLVHMNAVVLLDTLVIQNLLSLAMLMAARTITDAFQNHVT